MAALALATDPPTEEILDRKPAKSNAPLISITMWKMIIGQAIFQLVVTFTLYYAGMGIFPLKRHDNDDEEAKKVLRSMVFNTFVWMQIFNEFNNRRLDNKFNIFQGIHRNYFFIIINAIMVAAQVAIAFFGGEAFSITPINGWQWAVCLVLAALCLPWAVAIRVFPDAWFAAAARFVGTPVLLVYRPVKRFLQRANKIFRIPGRRNCHDSSTSETAGEPHLRNRDVEKYGN
jgi:P-type Ca2+ transporter type 2C